MGAIGVLLPHHSPRYIVIISDVQPQSGGVNVPVAPDQKRAEHRLRQQIQDPVEDGLGVGSDDVSTLRKTPCDRVEEPEEDGPDTTHRVGPRDVGADGGGVFARGPGYSPGNPQEGDTAEGEKAPLGKC